MIKKFLNDISWYRIKYFFKDLFNNTPTQITPVKTEELSFQVQKNIKSSIQEDDKNANTIERNTDTNIQGCGRISLFSTFIYIFLLIILSIWYYPGFSKKYLGLFVDIIFIVFLIFILPIISAGIGSLVVLIIYGTRDKVSKNNENKEKNNGKIEVDKTDKSKINNTSSNKQTIKISIIVLVSCYLIINLIIAVIRAVF